MARIWYCPNCGYEVHGRGRCHSCRQKLVASELPELEAGDEDEEVGYRLGAWGNRDRGRLIEYLNALTIPHRFEEDELVVTAEDEERVDDLVAELMATSSHGDEDDDDDYGGAEALGEDGWEPRSGTPDFDTAASVALLADAAKRLRGDPTDMQADADVAEASAAVFIGDDFYGVDPETWAAIGRVTRRLLTALGADEALEEEIRLQAGVLSKLLESVPLPEKPAAPTGPAPIEPGPVEPAPIESGPVEPGSVESGPGEHAASVAPNPIQTSAIGPVGGVADGARSARLAVGTVYELTEWLPEQRAHLSLLLDDNGIVYEWEDRDLVLDSSREAEAEALFSLVGGLEPEDEDDDSDEVRYHAIEELFNAAGRLASDPEDPQRRADALDWAGEVDGPTPVGMNEVFWLRVIKSIHALTAALESDGDDDAIAAEAATLHDLLRSIV
ncbi:MAG TPA: hypothetical protein VFZ97_19215 [Acidimicrobiales bacterium]